MCVTDRFSGQVRLLPCRKSITGAGAAKLYEQHIYVLHGWPTSAVSDRDPRFTGSFYQTIMAQAGVDLRMSTAAHPQTDGQAERAIGTASQILLGAVVEASTSTGVTWAEALPHVEFAMNSSVNRSTGLTPFDVVYGCTPSAFPEAAAVASSGANEDALELAARIRFLSEWARDRIVQVRTSSTIVANRTRREVSFNVGDYVWLSTKHFRAKAGTVARLLPKFVGPLRVMEVRAPAYKLALPESMRRRYPVFHVSLLKPAQASEEVITIDDSDSIDESAPPRAVVGTDGGQVLVEWGDQSTSWEDGHDFGLRYPDAPVEREGTAQGRPSRVRRPPGFLADYEC